MQWQLKEPCLYSPSAPSAAFWGFLLFAVRCKAFAEFDIPSQALDSHKTERSGPGRAKGGPLKV